MSTALSRRIAHLDMDAFFASVTLLQYPQLQALPVVIGGRRMTPEELVAHINERHPGSPWRADALQAINPDHFPRLGDYRGRGVATTATYAARQFGLGSGMGLARGAHLCPQGTSLDKGAKRHPTLGKGVIVGANSQVLGRLVRPMYGWKEVLVNLKWGNLLLQVIVLWLPGIFLVM